MSGSREASARELSIVFSAAEVLAVADGTMSQVRRAVDARRARGGLWDRDDVRPFVDDRGKVQFRDASGSIADARGTWLPRPMARVGCRLWVRETFYCDDFRYPGGPREDLLRAMDYRADHDCRTYEAGCPCADEDGRSSWRSATQMPRWAARHLLEVTGVRVERLRDISEEDARVEGVVFGRLVDARINGEVGKVCYFNARDAFAHAWSFRNGSSGPGSWGGNPWVWVRSFCRVEDESAAPEATRGAM